MESLKALFLSKKFLVAVGGVFAVVLMHFLSIPEETSMKVFGIVISYIAGQGLADMGKEAAKIENK